MTQLIRGWLPCTRGQHECNLQQRYERLQQMSTWSSATRSMAAFASARAVSRSPMRFAILTSSFACVSDTLLTAAMLRADCSRKLLLKLFSSLFSVRAEARVTSSSDICKLFSVSAERAHDLCHVARLTTKGSDHQKPTQTAPERLGRNCHVWHCKFQGVGGNTLARASSRWDFSSFCSVRLLRIDSALARRVDSASLLALPSAACTRSSRFQCWHQFCAQAQKTGERAWHADTVYR